MSPDDTKNAADVLLAPPISPLPLPPLEQGAHATVGFSLHCHNNNNDGPTMTPMQDDIQDFVDLPEHREEHHPRIVSSCLSSFHPLGDRTNKEEMPQLLDDTTDVVTRQLPSSAIPVLERTRSLSGNRRSRKSLCSPLVLGDNSTADAGAETTTPTNERKPKRRRMSCLLPPRTSLTQSLDMYRQEHRRRKSALANQLSLPLLQPETNGSKPTPTSSDGSIAHHASHHEDHDEKGKWKMHDRMHASRNNQAEATTPKHANGTHADVMHNAFAKACQAGRIDERLPMGSTGPNVPFQAQNDSSNHGFARHRESAKPPGESQQRVAFEPIYPHSDAQKLAELRKLVHSYTLLAPEERAKSKEVASISELSGYVLTPPLEDLNSAQLPSEESPNVGIFNEIEPALRRMDVAKILATRFNAQETGCIYKRAKGKYRYYDGSTREVVRPEAYEARYLTMLEDTTRVQSKIWADYFADVLWEWNNARGKGKIDTQSGDEGMASLTCTKATTDLEALLGGKVSSNMLPFPPRDAMSCDPDIARAERRLWSAIDDALTTYSQEVMAIRAAKTKKDDETLPRKG